MTLAEYRTIIKQYKFLSFVRKVLLCAQREYCMFQKFLSKNVFLCLVTTVVFFVTVAYNKKYIFERLHYGNEK